MSKNIRVALDWTPNVLHVGLFVAQAKGYYKDAGLNVEFLQPDSKYSVPPAKRVERQEAELAICPSESCIAYAEDRLKGNRLLELQAIYAILQIDASAIVSVKPQFRSCASLSESAVYGSYGAKYEDHIVRKMINYAGGNGDGLETDTSTEKLRLWDQVKSGTGKVDATWVFLPWEGLEAKREGVQFNAFRPNDYGVPYGYSPVIARDATRDLGEGVLDKFVRATAQGYSFAMLDLTETTAILAQAAPDKDKDFLRASVEYIVEYLNDPLGRVDVGVMRGQKWHKWVDWLKEEGLVRQDVRVDDLYTNEFFGHRRGSE